MKKGIKIAMVAGTIGIFVGVLISILITSLSTPPYFYMPLVKTWDEIVSGKVKNLDGFAPIGNGLYNAIDICRKNSGVISVEGRYNGKLICQVEHQTFLLNDFKWVGRKILK